MPIILSGGALRGRGSGRLPAPQDTGEWRQIVVGTGNLTPNWKTGIA